MNTPTWPSSSASVHPHMRGDNRSESCELVATAGSPPYAWGQWIAAWGVPSPARSTPVHPHMRGDNVVEAAEPELSTVAGSPPHAWGQWCQAVSWLPAHRFTPMRGDNVSGVPWPPRFPPHAWGQNFRQNPPLRFTPTCVGTMQAYAEVSTSSFGSPPHAWGQCPPLPRDPRSTRFTPTCVGTMEDMPVTDVRVIGSPPHAWGQCLNRERAVTCAPVHPHMRGDNNESFNACGAIAGSPPHAWGQCVHVQPGIYRRFTPTCVGTMILANQPTAARPVHPHMRGDNVLIPCTLCGCKWVLGSPPHAWGQL